MPPRVLLAALCVCASAAFVPPWTYDGFDRFPALWFGANASGLDNSSQLALVARHSLAGYGWQQGVNRTDYRHGETSLAQAAVHLADFVTESGQTANATPTKTFVYRHFQMSWAVFDITRAANANAANAAMFLRSNDNTGVQCGQPDAAHNTSSPLLVYLPLNESGATDFWVNEVVAEVALESSVDACFFDETVRNARPQLQYVPFTLLYFHRIGVIAAMPSRRGQAARTFRRLSSRLTIAPSSLPSPVQPRLSTGPASGPSFRQRTTSTRHTRASHPASSRPASSL